MDTTSTAGRNQRELETPFRQDVASSASTSAKAVSWDIFVNHREIDVKPTLASKIYDTLDFMGLRAFLDVEVFKAGDGIPEQIQQAMATASLHIAIISPNYAQSSLCLNELSFMLKTRTKIIPIFYNVEPSDLRLIDQGKGIYADAFSEHEQKGRYGPEKLREWKEALGAISFHSGYEVKKIEDEGSVLKNIVSHVLRFMKTIPVGLDELVQDFERISLQSPQNLEAVQLVGIWGMGGIGKTTIAKEIFKRKRSSFDKCSFMFDVRDCAARNDLRSLKEKLLNDLGVNHLPVDNVNEGSGVLTSRFSSVRALIVLDDVDHVDQLDALLPVADILRPDSLVIVTTREMRVLTSRNISAIYEMPRLKMVDAKQLFSWHAFLQPSPPSVYEDLVEMFATACGGLPLSLKVLGSQLCGRSMDYWASQSIKFAGILPTDINQRLRLSYDALDEEEREIFLDIACFFVGEKKSLAIEVWDGSGWNGLRGLETLVNKCLVDLDEQNCIRMHDHLRDMGREMASKRSPYRAWYPDQTLNIQISDERKKIRGIMATTTAYNGDITDYKYSSCGPPFQGFTKLMGISSGKRGGFQSPVGLELLVVKGHDFNQEFAKLSEDLIWLRWFEFQHRNLPSWLVFRNLRVLELHKPTDLEELWEPEALPLQLRELHITLARSFKTIPNSIGQLKHLRKVTLRGGPAERTSLIAQLPESLCSLQSLQSLDLRHCEKLSSLPRRFGMLTKLKHLNLLGCSELSILPEGFGRLKSLRYLNLRHCTNLSSLPSHFGALTQLEHLDLLGCRELRMLPASFGELTNIRYLDFTDCKRLNIHSDCKRLNITAFNTLSFFRYKELKEMPYGSTNLPSFMELADLGSDRHYQVITNQKATRQVYVCRCAESHHITNQTRELIICKSIQKFRKSIGQMQQLETIVVDGSVNTSLKALPEDFCNLQALRHLTLRWCRGLTSLPTHFGNLKGLQHLDLSFCNQLRELPYSFKQFKQLQHLSFEACSNLVIPPYILGENTTLLYLNFKDCGKLRVLPTRVPYQLSLKMLNLMGTSIKELPNEVGMLINLEVLEIGSPYLQALPNSMGNMVYLRTLNVKGCTSLKCLPKSLGLFKKLTIKAPEALMETLEEMV